MPAQCHAEAGALNSAGSSVQVSRRNTHKNCMCATQLPTCCAGLTRICARSNSTLTLVYDKDAARTQTHEMLSVSEIVQQSDARWVIQRQRHLWFHSNLQRTTATVPIRLNNKMRLRTISSHRQLDSTPW